MLQLAIGSLALQVPASTVTKGSPLVAGTTGLVVPTAQFAKPEACAMDGGRITGTAVRMDQYNGMVVPVEGKPTGLPGPMASLGDSAKFDPAELRAEACQLGGGRITGTVRRMDQYNGLDCTTTEATEGLPGPMASLGDKAKFAPDALRAEACQLGGGRPSGWVVRMDPYNGMDMTTDAFPRE